MTLEQLGKVVYEKLRPWKLAGDPEVRRPTFMVLGDDWFEPVANALDLSTDPDPVEYHQPSGKCGCGEVHS